MPTEDTTMSSPSKKRFQPRLEALEERAVPAVSFQLTGTTLFLTGDSHNDDVSFYEVQTSSDFFSTRLIVNWHDDTGNRGSRNFWLASLTKIEFRGNEGDDSLVNETNPEGMTMIANLAVGSLRPSSPPMFSVVPSMMPMVEAYGGRGSDLLRPGSCRGNDLDGGRDNDRLHGGASTDHLYGRGDTDHLYGYGGSDWLFGGGDTDFLYGGGQDDWLEGGRQDDWLFGGGGVDHLYGEEGNDRLYGDYTDTDNDRLFGDGNTDYLHGGDGNDYLRGGSGEDWLYGDDGDDRLYGDDGPDHLYGGRNDDDLYGREGRDWLYGNSGNDGLYGGTEYDELTGGEGKDRFLEGPDDSDLFKDLNRPYDVRVPFRNNPALNNMKFDGRNEASRWDVAPGAWTEADIEEVDAALSNLVKATGNTRLLKRANDARGLNPIVYCMSGAATQVEGEPDLDFNAWNDGSNIHFVLTASKRTVYHEIGHNWDTAEELGSERYQDWLDLSGWVSTSTNPGSDYTATSPDDDQWYMLNDAVFATDYARRNPQEDMAETFEAYFSRYDIYAVYGDGTPVPAETGTDGIWMPRWWLLGKRAFLSELFGVLSINDVVDL
jgi:Ca2+-binding RTX toxin-like protein